MLMGNAGKLRSRDRVFQTAVTGGPGQAKVVYRFPSIYVPPLESRDNKIMTDGRNVYSRFSVVFCIDLSFGGKNLAAAVTARVRLVCACESV